MKTPFRRQLMFILLAAFAALPLIAAPAPDTPFGLATFELTQSPTGELSLTKAVVPNNNLELATLFVNLDDATNYFLIKESDLLAASVDDDAAQFTFANTEKTTATLRRVLTINTKNSSYVLMAIYRAMNMEVPLPPTVLAHGNTKTGGDMFQINTMFDERAATLDQQPDGAWIVTR